MASEHRVELGFEAGYGARLKLLHPEGGCQPATACAECGQKITDPARQPCPDCPDEVADECWLTGWVEQYTADEVLAGSVEFPVVPECDGEEFTLHVAAEPADSPSLQGVRERLERQAKVYIEACDKVIHGAPGDFDSRERAQAEGQKEAYYRVLAALPNQIQPDSQEGR